MRPLPILMKPEMAAAVVNKTKTQTRRMHGLDEINKDLEEMDASWAYEGCDTDPYLIAGSDKWGEEIVKQVKGFHAFFHWTGMGDIHRSVKSKYDVGDVLYVRENWRYAGGEKPLHESVVSRASIVYEADEPWNGPFKPSIHLRQQHARTYVQVKEVRVERVQDISEEDAKAEGVNEFVRWRVLGNNRLEEMWCRRSMIMAHQRGQPEPRTTTDLGSWWMLFNYAAGAGSFEKNPFVFVYEFEVLSTTGFTLLVKEALGQLDFVNGKLTLPADHPFVEPLKNHPYNASNPKRSSQG